MANTIFDMVVHHPESLEALENMNLAETYICIDRETKLLHGPEYLRGRIDVGHGFKHFKRLSGEYVAP
jgi:hypothetical protein